MGHLPPAHAPPGPCTPRGSAQGAMRGRMCGGAVRGKMCGGAGAGAGARGGRSGGVDWGGRSGGSNARVRVCT